MISKLSVLMLATVMVFGQSCNAYDVMVSVTKVDAAEKLWADVPQVDGAVKVDAELPPATRTELDGLQAKNVNYVAYSTSRTAAEVEAAYSRDRMANAGWGSASKCLGGASLSQGAVCVYYRSPDPKNNVLAIHIAEDPKTKATVIFYMRFQLVFEDEELEQLAR